MFILRGISFILSIFGYLLAVAFAYLGFVPLQYPVQPELNLKSLIACNTTKSTYALSDLTQTNIDNLKAKTGTAAPIELVRDFMNSIDNITQNIGATPQLYVEYCDVSQTSVQVLTKVNDELKKVSKYYEFQPFNDFVKRVNDLPFAKLSNVELKLDSTFARTNFCNAPITKMKMYLFTVIDSNIQSVKKSLMFEINLIERKDNKDWQKISNNIVTSGHYLKAQTKCNG